MRRQTNNLWLPLRFPPVSRTITIMYHDAGWLAPHDYVPVVSQLLQYHTIQIRGQFSENSFRVDL